MRKWFGLALCVCVLQVLWWLGFFYHSVGPKVQKQIWWLWQKWAGHDVSEVSEQAKTGWRGEESVNEEKQKKCVELSSVSQVTLMSKGILNVTSQWRKVMNYIKHNTENGTCWTMKELLLLKRCVMHCMFTSFHFKDIYKHLKAARLILHIYRIQKNKACLAGHTFRGVKKVIFLPHTMWLNPLRYKAKAYSPYAFTVWCSQCTHWRLWTAPLLTTVSKD